MGDNKKIRPAEKSTTVTKVLGAGLYGLDTTKCCSKDQSSEKVANVLLPVAYGLYSIDNRLPIPLCNAFLVRNIEKCFSSEIKFDTEKVHDHIQFINPPPNDIRATLPNSSVYYECKVVLYKKKKTELVLRQDCYAFNCIQNVLINNPTKTYQDTNSLLGDMTIVERPYMWMLIWEKTDAVIYFDCMVFTDVSVIRMIKDSDTPRAKEALKLIDVSLSEFASNGSMTYKLKKSTTVAHQKVSLFPFRDLAILKVHEFNFRVKSTDIILKDVRSDSNLWQVVDKIRLMDKIRLQDNEIRRLKKLCGESQ